MTRLFKGPDEFDLTSGSIGRPLFYLSLPLILTNLMRTAYNLADTFWVGRYGTNELAAISFTFPMVFLFISLGLGLSIAGSVLVAQNTGAGEQKRAEFAASQTITITALTSLVLGAITYVIAGPLLTVFGAEPAVHPLAKGYLQIISFGLLPMFTFSVFISLMRGYGDTVTPMLVMFATVVANILLDPILIFGFVDNPLFSMLGMQGLESQLLAATGYTGHGLDGAAIATVLSRLAASLIGIGILVRGSRGLQIHIDQLTPDPMYLRRLLRVGIPASIDGVGRAVSVNLLMILVGVFPSTVVAGYGIGIRIFSLVFLPANAVEQSVETMVGQNIGSGKPDRAERANTFAAQSVGLILTGIGVLVFFVARPLTAVFTTNPAVVDVGTQFLRYVALTFGGIGVVRSYTGGFRGVGKTMVAAVISIAMLGLIRLPIAAVGVVGLGLDQRGIWYGFIASNILGAAIAYLWFRSDSWDASTVTRDEASEE